MAQGFSYKSGRMMGGTTKKGARASQSGADLVKNIRAQIKLGKK